MVDLQIVGLALLGGFIPAFIWLAFWLTEDRCQPEPRVRIALTFLAGMAAIAIAIPIEQYAATIADGTAKLFMWAATEEILKLIAAAIFGLLSASNDEPLDAIIYMVTAALGFAAAENALFLFGTLADQGILQGMLLGNIRFVGSTILHSLSSATLGLVVAFAFFRPNAERTMTLVAGLILAIVLHTLFNFSILSEKTSFFTSAFLSIWAGTVALLFLIERIKHTKDYC